MGVCLNIFSRITGDDFKVLISWAEILNLNVSVWV